MIAYLFGQRQCMEAQPMLVRYAIESDFPALADIDFAGYAAASAWTPSDFRLFRREPNSILMVADDMERCLGFVAFIPRRGDLHIENVAICPGQRRRGIGSLLVGKVRDKLAMFNRRRIVCEVREHNVGAQVFLSANGFVCNSIIRGYYADTDEDGLQFVYEPDGNPGWEE